MKELNNKELYKLVIGGADNAKGWWDTVSEEVIGGLEAIGAAIHDAGLCPWD